MSVMDFNRRQYPPHERPVLVSYLADIRNRKSDKPLQQRVDSIINAWPTRNRKRLANDASRVQKGLTDNRKSR